MGCPLPQSLKNMCAPSFVVIVGMSCSPVIEPGRMTRPEVHMIFSALVQASQSAGRLAKTNGMAAVARRRASLADLALTRALPVSLVQSAKNNPRAAHSLSQEPALESKSMSHRLTPFPSSSSAETRTAPRALGRRISGLCCPSDVFSTGQPMNHAGTTIELRDHGRGHTDSDVSVRFPDADILHAGDSYWNGVCPMIDYSSGCPIDGAIAAAEANLRATTDSTIVILGHGHPVNDQAELKAFRDMLGGVRAKVAALKRQGHSLEAITALRPTAAWNAEWGNFVINPALFTGLVYEGV
jgi:hypothetical protein